MNLDHDDVQQALHEVFGQFFRKESTPAVVRDSEALGFSPALWHALGALDVNALATDAGLLDATIAAEPAGRHLAPVPFAEHVAAARALARLGIAVPSGPITLALQREAPLVPAGAVATHVLADTADGLVLASGDAPGVALANYAGLPIAARSLASATVIGPAADHARVVDEWRILMASMLVGLADAALELGVEYVTARHQFGVPIGSFQAIQHGLAEFPGPISGARLLVARAAWRADNGEDRLAADAPMALLFATELARAVTARVLHYHGGYGVMEEYDIQLFYRRAKGWPAQLGDPAAETERLAGILYGEA